MAQGQEVQAAQEWLYTTLSGDAQLTAVVGDRIYPRRAPQNTAYPYVFFQLQSGLDTNAANAVRIWTDCLFSVFVVTKGSSSEPIEPALKRIDALLHKASPTTNDRGEIFDCVRENALELNPVVNGIEYLQIGGVYRIHVQG